MYGGQFGACCTPMMQRSCLKSAEGLAKMMTVIVTVLEAAGLTVSDKKTETMLLLRTPDQAPYTSPPSSRQQARGTDGQRSFCIWAVLSTQAPIYAKNQTAGPTRMGMLQSIQSGTVRYGGCPVRSEVAHAKGRGDGNPAVRVRNAVSYTHLTLPTNREV